jgi:hypothetical protein
LSAATPLRQGSTDCPLILGILSMSADDRSPIPHGTA